MYAYTHSSNNHDVSGAPATSLPLIHNSSLNTMSCLAHVFEQDNALDKLEAFTSLNGPAWYGLAPNEERISMVRQADPVAFPDKRDTGAGLITVFDPMFPLHWEVVET